MTKRGSYRLDEFSDKRGEAALLDVRSSWSNEAVSELQSMGVTFGRNARILDVGSGTGLFSLSFARFAFEGEVVGIDVSRELLERAGELREKSGRQNLRFVEADVLSKKQLEPLGKFDFIFMRLVLQHLPDPKKALKNLKQILNPGGFIYLEEPDRDSLIMYPAPADWAEFHKNIKQGQINRGGDPNMGRKLAHLLSETGYKEVRSIADLIKGDSAAVRSWTKLRAPTYLNFLSPQRRRKAVGTLKKMEALSLENEILYCEIVFRAVARA